MAISSDPRDGHETLRLLPLPPRILCASTGHYPHHSPRRLCSPPLPGSRDPGTTSLEEHTAPQAVAMSRWPLLPQARPVFQLWLPYPSLSLAWVSQSPLISRCFNPLLSGQGTDAWGQPTSRGRAKTKAEPQELGKQRGEREISPCSLRNRGLNPHSQLEVPCICGIPEWTTNRPKIEVVDFRSNCRLGVCCLWLICFWYLCLS